MLLRELDKFSFATMDLQINHDVTLVSFLCFLGLFVRVQSFWLLVSQFGHDHQIWIHITILGHELSQRAIVNWCSSFLSLEEGMVARPNLYMVLLLGSAQRQNVLSFTVDLIDSHC